jgi:hypothetical protein
MPASNPVLQDAVTKVNTFIHLSIDIGHGYTRISFRARDIVKLRRVVNQTRKIAMVLSIDLSTGAHHTRVEGTA